MRLNFCTVFDTFYLSKGLALYHSLVAHAGDFHLYVIAFNDRAHQILTELELPHATIISLGQFENEELLRVKPGRTIGEYCWTCTSSAIAFCLDTYRLEQCTYVDADLYFFASPRPLVDEMGEASVLITAHRYTPAFDQSTVSGKYCVQFMTFKNTIEGRACLQWWIDACIDWCFATPEDGKFGDQKYLDDWPQRFTGIHELVHLGGGVAPWNIQQYDFEEKNGLIRGREKSTNRLFDMVFFHFHDVKFYDNGSVDFGNYPITSTDIRLLFAPYLRHLDRIGGEIKTRFDLNPHGIRPTPEGLRNMLRQTKRRLKGIYNRFDLKTLIR